MTVCYSIAALIAVIVHEMDVKLYTLTHLLID